MGKKKKIQITAEIPDTTTGVEDSPVHPTQGSELFPRENIMGEVCLQSNRRT